MSWAADTITIVLCLGALGFIAGVRVTSWRIRKIVREELVNHRIAVMPSESFNRVVRARFPDARPDIPPSAKRTLRDGGSLE